MASAPPTVMETRSETTREARRRGKDGKAPNARDRKSVAPAARRADRMSDPAKRGQDLRHDGRLKGASTGGSAR